MSSFTCEHCKFDLIDTPNGYVTFCEHYPEVVIGEPLKKSCSHTTGKYYVCKKCKEERKEKIKSTNALGCVHGTPPGLTCMHCMSICTEYPGYTKKPHQGHVIEGTPVSCDCQCWCNESKYDVGTMLSAQCEHCKYLLNKPVSCGKECDSYGYGVKEMDKDWKAIENKVNGMMMCLCAKQPCTKNHRKEIDEAWICNQAIEECIAIIKSMCHETEEIEGLEVPKYAAMTLWAVEHKLEALKSKSIQS